MRNRNQVVLPLNLEICIPKDDPVFKMVEICEQLDYTELYRADRRSMPDGYSFYVDITGRAGAGSQYNSEISE